MTASAASAFDASAVVVVVVVSVALKLPGKVENHCQIKMLPRMAKL